MPRPNNLCFTLLTTAVLLLAQGFTPAQAQSEEPQGETPGTASDADDPSRETDVSEDNYRRYMELEDARQERPAFPTTVFRPPSSLQKMAQLPEDSQKHLRNQLRGIILQSGPWTEGEAEKEYPFVPSQAARRDGELLQAEAEAWSELVQEYHEREAATLAGRSGTPPDGSGGPGSADPSGEGEADGQMEANGMPGGPQGEAPAGDPSQGQGQAQSQSQGQGQAQAQQQGQGQGESQGGEAGQSGDNGQGAQSGAQNSADNRQNQPQPENWQDNNSTPGNEMSTEGVEQSASDFLRQRGMAQEPTSSQGMGTGTGQEPGTQPPPDSGRWGEDAQRVLGPPPSAESANNRGNDQPGGQPPRSSAPGTAEQEPSADDSVTLTLDELRDVRGVQPQEGTGESLQPAFDALPPVQGNGAATGTDPEPVISPGEEDTPVPEIDEDQD